MLPTLRLGQVVSVRSLRAHDRIERGEIVVFKAPPGTDPAIDDLAKRVIGLPHETVSAKRGHMYVEGKELTEPYLPASTITSDLSPVGVPPNAYWVMGDNRGTSTDSRVFGPIRRVDIVGVVELPSESVTTTTCIDARTGAGKSGDCYYVAYPGAP